MSLIGHRDTTAPWNQNERCSLSSVPSLEYSKLSSHEVWAFFFLKAQCTARAANRLNTSPLTHAHMKTPRNKHVHTHINQDLLWQWLFCPFVSLLPSLLQRSAEQDRFTCISWELCRWASYGLLAAFIFFSIRHIEKLWTYTKTKNGGTAVDPEKGRIQLHLPFL